MILLCSGKYIGFGLNGTTIVDIFNMIIFRKVRCYDYGFTTLQWTDRRLTTHIAESSSNVSRSCTLLMLRNHEFDGVEIRREDYKTFPKRW